MMPGHAVDMVTRKAAAAVRRWDPNTDPTAEPLSMTALAVVAAATVVNLVMFCRWKYQPMQDFPLHVACAKYVAEWGRSDSVYRGLFARPDLLAGNTLIYLLAGFLGKVVSVVFATRLLVGLFYIVGLPVSTIYALRTFGRSAWGGVLSTALVFGRMYVSGFVNELVAFPIALWILVRFYKLLFKPTLRETFVVAFGLSVLFLAHSFVFLWFGAVLAGMFFVCLPWASQGDLRRAGVVTGNVALAVLPSLLLFARWFLRSSSRFGADVPGAKFGPTFVDASEQFRQIPEFIAYTESPKEMKLLAWLLLLLGVSIGLSRLERRRSPPVLEIVCAATFFSYFLLPRHIMSEGVVGKRQLDHAMWLLPVFVTPVAARTSRIARGVVIAGILLQTYARASFWRGQLDGFEHEEAGGLASVIAAAPPGLRLHYPRIHLESKYFAGKQLWHPDYYYVAERGGMIREIPAADDPRWWLHFAPERTWIPYHSGENGETWWQLPAIWETYDLVLLFRWHPSPEALAAVQSHATRIASSGDWELWQTKR